MAAEINRCLAPWGLQTVQNVHEGTPTEILSSKSNETRRRYFRFTGAIYFLRCIVLTSRILAVVQRRFKGTTSMGYLVPRIEQLSASSKSNHYLSPWLWSPDGWLDSSLFLLLWTLTRWLARRLNRQLRWRLSQWLA